MVSVPDNLNDHAVTERMPPWGVLIIESHHSPGFSMDWRTHSFVKIVYVLRGSGTFHLGNHDQKFETGDIVVVAPGIRNRIVDTPGAASSLYVACVADSHFRFDPTIVDRIGTRVIHGDGAFASRVASVMRRLVHAQETASRDRPIAMVTEAIKLIQLTLNHPNSGRRQQRTPGALLGDVQGYINALPTHFFDETTIDEVASSLNMSRRSFTEAFHKLTGETWLTYVRRLAIDHARRRLTESDLPIVSIAFECGFNDLSTFYRQFKNQCGISPAKYRAQH
ncbi:helix-turn-helix transcriptional regulator [Rubripirellula reticaptiva]|uniref:HTH-type transcriptional activator RhaS n=1 Tax=Rubripirellula reticaptiva TaxID=2528013 RepID=A0A5C6EH45_9BACT|nr:AraC family transcriptional regulator [Rubripirellula reticaptiva]TWU47860.1 HTH-type transcriptional activator RhaS [Rubripirellula reticaptiva]